MRKWGLTIATCSSLLPATALAAVRVEVGQASGYPGWVVDLPVTLAIEGEAPSSVGHTLFFPDPRSVKVQRRSDGEPDCTPAEGVPMPGRFAFWPVGCVDEEDECDAVTALFVDLSGTLPNLPAGPLFSCKVRISTAAAPGTYLVQNVDPESSARRGRALSTSGSDGAVQVLQPPGGGGCAVTGGSAAASWWPIFLVAVVLQHWLRVRGCALVGSQRRWIIASVLFASSVALCGAALAQATEVYVEGRWFGQGKEGTWAGELVVAENGGVSGQVRFAGLEALPVANVLAVWSSSGLRQGSLFYPGGAVRAGRLRGSWGAAGVAGEFTGPDGSLFTWELRAVRAQREKVAPPRASALLARGQPATVVVNLDDYAAVRAARARSRNLAIYEWDSEDAEAAYNQTLAALREQVLGALDPRSVAVIQRNRLLPSLVLQLYDFDALSRLLTLDGVRSVGDRHVYDPLLRQSLPLIGQPAAMSRGFDGIGATVAVLDTGVDWLLRSDAQGNLAFGNGCQNGPGAPGCAVAVMEEAAPEDGVRDAEPFHGTNVAGIAWSVAPASRVAGVDVFQPDGAHDADIIAGLEWVGRNWRNYDIVAVNLSLGGRFTSPCPQSNLADPIRTLRRAGRLVVAASGNDGWADAVADPACVPRVVRVAAVYDRAFQQFDTQVCQDFNVLPDQVTCFSNSAGFLSMLAPGAVIQFATLAFAGTSQAAPHVAGAIAALRTRDGRYRTDPSDCIVARFVKTGTGVSDPRNGLRFPRLNLDMATQTLPNSSGDCNGDERVEVSEVETGVSIALGDLNLVVCPRFDPTGDGQVTIDELVTSVNVRIYTCAVGESGVV